MLVKIIQSDARAREKPCLRCGLSLRKMFDTRYCPDCGLSVWLSLNDNQNLDWSNPSWLRRLSLAACLMAPAQFIGFLAYCIAVVPIGAEERRFPIAAIAAGVYLICYHVGLLLMCMHENRYPDRLKIYRVSNQVIAVVAIFAGAALLMRGITRLPGGWPITHVQMPTTLPHGVNPEDVEDTWGAMQPLALETQAWLWLAEFVLVASAVGTFAFLRRLAQRAGNSTLSRICGYILLAPAISLLKVFPFFGYFLIASLWGLTEYIPIFYFPVTAGLLVWFAISFRRCSKNAAEGWTKETLLPAAATVAAH